MGLYAAALVGIGLAIGGLFRASIAGEIVAVIVVATYVIDLLAPALQLPDWVHQLALTAHLGQPMIGIWDWAGMAACVVLAVGGLAVRLGDAPPGHRRLSRPAAGGRARQPESAARARARSSSRTSFPTELRGSRSTNAIDRGTSCSPSRSRQNARSSASVVELPGERTTKAAPTLSPPGAGMPTTPTSATDGWSSSDPFDVAGEDELARRDVPGVEPIHDPDVAVVVHARGITGAQPATLDELLARLDGPSPVAGHDVGAAHQQLAGAARPYVGPVGVADPNIDEQGRLPGRADLVQRLLGIEKQHQGRRFREPVTLEERHVPIEERADEAFRYRRPAGEHEADAREIGRGPPLGVRERVEEVGVAEADGYPVPLDRAAGARRG